MKSIKIIALVAFGLLLGISSAEAQEKQNRGKYMNKVAVETMTAQQKQLLQEQRELIKEQRKLFRASLSTSQLAILDNKDLTRQARQDALKSSLTETQKALMQEHRKSVKESKQQFRNTLTTEQRQQIRDRMQLKKETKGGNELHKKGKEYKKQRENIKSGN